jgi:hypothetical protein
MSFWRKNSGRAGSTGLVADTTKPKPVNETDALVDEIEAAMRQVLALTDKIAEQLESHSGGGDDGR